MSAPGLPLPVTQGPRDRLRNEIRRERELADRVLASQRRLADEKTKRDAAIAAHDSKVAARADDLADALLAYVDTARVRPERAAVVLGVPRSTIIGMIRERRAALRRIKLTSGPVSSG